MAGCCDPRGCDRVFDDGFARRTAAAYRTRGLDATAHAMVAAVVEHGVQGATVLEIGGGVGAIQLELLRRGAASATNLELSPAYEAEAAALAAEAGLAGRVTRRIVDIAADPDAVEPADVVVLHRVVCCYPDHASLLGAAAARAGRQLVFSFPPRNPATAVSLVADNVWRRLRRQSFRAFAHPPAAMLAVLVDHGLPPRLVHRRPLWWAASAVR